MLLWSVALSHWNDLLCVASLLVVGDHSPCNDLLCVAFLLSFCNRRKSCGQCGGLSYADCEPVCVCVCVCVYVCVWNPIPLIFFFFHVSLTCMVIVAHTCARALSLYLFRVAGSSSEVSSGDQSLSKLALGRPGETRAHQSNPASQSQSSVVCAVVIVILSWGFRPCFRKPSILFEIVLTCFLLVVHANGVVCGCGVAVLCACSSASQMKSNSVGHVFLGLAGW